MMTLTVKICHADYSNVPSFARVVEAAFGGQVSILPSREVMAACLRAGGKRTREVSIDVVGDREGIWTAYQIDGQWGECVLISHDDVIEFAPGQEDTEDPPGEVVAKWLADYR